MLAFAVLGSLVGLAVSLLWPPLYRASAEVFVALNPYRSYADRDFVAQTKERYSNLDDYKNWQMSQLQSVVFLEEILQDTLGRLQQEDVYWSEVSLERLQGMLSTEWRSAGAWSLVAHHRQLERAAQAASAWEAAALQRIEAATAASRRLISLDGEIQAVATARLETSQRLETLEQARAALEGWEGSLASLSQDQPMTATQRWQVLTIVSGAASFTPQWSALLQSQPAEEAPLAAYLGWIAHTRSVIESELAETQNKLDELEKLNNPLLDQYEQQAEASLGLSPNLEFSHLGQSAAQPLRPTSLMVLIGAIIGLCVWALFELIAISRTLHASR
jgi:hypothetical protein